MKSPHFIPFLIFTTVFFFDLSSANANPNPPSFSHPSGFYAKEFQLELTSDDPDAVILFTLDGSLPNPAHLNGASYQLKNSVDGPFTIRQIQTYEYESSSSIFLYNRTEETNQVSAIPTHWYLFRSPSYSVPKGIVVRAATLRDGELSEIVTNVYFVGEEFEAFLDLGVLSITIQEDHFWGYENGINVPGRTFNPDADPIWFNNGNYYQSGAEWERPVHIEFFDQDGTSGFSQQAGLRIHGGTSRWMVNRSLRLYARSDYGQNTIDYPLFAQRGFQRHKRLKLRTSGQDYEYTYFRDALMSRLMMESEMTVEEYRPVNLFINGEYWGITNIRERFDAHYAERNFGIPREEVEIGSTTHYREFRNYILNHDASEEEYYDEVSKRIYLDSLLDLKIAEIFFGRWDMHWEQWRDGRDPESRWRWVMWDFDVGMDLPGFQPPLRADWTGSNEGPAVSLDYLRPFLTDYRTRRDRNEEFSLIMKNPQIRDRFLTRLAMMMSSNLGKQRMIGEINTIQKKLRNTMPLHVQRWDALSRGIHTMEKWEDEIERLRFFSTHRQRYVYQHAIDFFELEGLANIKILKPAPGGTIHLFDEDLEQLIKKSGTEEATEWVGTLFRGLPIRVEAKATPGYRFAGWSEPFEEHGPILEFTLEADLTVILPKNRTIG